MANEENLRPPYGSPERGSEEAREDGIKGGVASGKARRDRSEKRRYIDFLLKTKEEVFDAQDIMYIRQRIGAMKIEELLKLEKTKLPADIAEELSAKLASITDGSNNQNEKRINREIGKEKIINEITGRDGEPITFQDARTAFLEKFNQLRGPDEDKGDDKKS